VTKAVERIRALETLWFAMAIGVFVFLSKLPWAFTTLGEQDHGRFILAAMIYAEDGPQTIRPYAMLTSPMWTLPLSLLSRFWTAPQLVLFSNVMGWIAGGGTAAVGYVLLRRLACPRSWAAAGAVAATWVPGAFYASLYGYPSQWALPFLLLPAVTFLCALDAGTTRARWAWFVATTVGFCVLALLKVDFALTGTLLVGMAWMRRAWNRPVSLALPAVAVVASGLVLLLSRLLIAQTYGDFASGWAGLYPGRSSPLEDPFAATTLYSVGVGTAILWGLATLAGVIRPSTRRDTLRALLAWSLAVLPLWMFWMTRPPMSSRHALPGAVLTALFAAWLAGRQAPRTAWLAPVWLVVLLLLNGVWGTPGFDFNYRPSGRLPAGARLNRQAFAVGQSIADEIAAPTDRIKAILGEPDPDVLGGIDLLPLVEFAMASRSVQTRCVGQIDGPTDPHTHDIIFTDASGRETRLLRYVDPRRVGLYRGDGVGFYAPWGLQGARVNVLGVEVVTFDPLARYREMFGSGGPTGSAAASR